MGKPSLTEIKSPSEGHVQEEQMTAQVYQNPKPTFLSLHGPYLTFFLEFKTYIFFAPDKYGYFSRKHHQL